MIRCTNIECPAQLLRNLIHFASRDAMDIDGLGPAILELLIDEKIIASATDLYHMDYARIAELDGMGETSAENIRHSVDKSKGNDLSRLVFALGIRGIGAKGGPTAGPKIWRNGCHHRRHSGGDRSHRRFW